MIDIRQRRLIEHLQAENEQLHEIIDTQDAALAELAELAAMNEATNEDISAAVCELAEIVGGE